MRNGNGISGGGERRRSRRLSALIAAIVVSGSLVATSAGAAAADTASGSSTSKVSATGSKAATPAPSSSASGSATSHVAPALVKPFTATGCHTYDYWSGAHVCMTVYGGGLNVQSVSGETDGPDSDWGQLYDTAGVINLWGHPTNHYLSVSWASGGGIWLANGDNFCFSDTTLGQTSCVTVHS
jgi:hypothetical protein